MTCSRREQVVQAIDLEAGVRESPASAHHLMEVVVMLRVEGRQHRDDRVPRVGAPGHEQVAADVAGESVASGESPPPLLHPSSYRATPPRDRRHARAVRAPRSPRSTSIPASFCAATVGARFHQHFEPHAETIGVELLVQAWLGGAPQVEIEDARNWSGVASATSSPQSSSPQL